MFVRRLVWLRPVVLQHMVQAPLVEVALHAKYSAQPSPHEAFPADILNQLCKLCTCGALVQTEQRFLAQLVHVLPAHVVQHEHGAALARARRLQQQQREVALAVVRKRRHHAAVAQQAQHRLGVVQVEAQLEECERRVRLVVLQELQEDLVAAAARVHDDGKPCLVWIVCEQLQQQLLWPQVHECTSVQHATSPADVHVIAGTKVDAHADPLAHLFAQGVLAVELLQQLLSRQATTLHPRHGDRLVRQVAVRKAHREEAGVRVAQRHEGCHRRRAGVRLLDVDTGVDAEDCDESAVASPHLHVDQVGDGVVHVDVADAVAIDVLLDELLCIVELVVKVCMKEASAVEQDARAGCHCAALASQLQAVEAVVEKHRIVRQLPACRRCPCGRAARSAAAA
mmetsp:Transcript_5926/g.18221  ORF Transcript_5926/g.18221 Transcript_5926/m.18221 type:complete len:397 (-) Transcript_5926:4361-5551(-)